jgi:hypothetical protein
LKGVTVLRKVLLGCGVVSSILYVATDIMGARRYEGYHYADQWFSELTAEGAPTRTFMVVTNSIPYTVLMAGFGLGLWRALAERRAARIVATLLLNYAAFGAAGGIAFPMETRGNDQTIRNVMHIPATALMSLSLVVAMGFASTLLGHRFRYYTYATIATVLVCGMVTSLQAGKIADNEATPWAGIEQRVNIYSTMLWLAVLAIATWRSHVSAVSRSQDMPVIGTNSLRPARR